MLLELVSFCGHDQEIWTSLHGSTEDQFIHLNFITLISGFSFDLLLVHGSFLSIS